MKVVSFDHKICKDLNQALHKEWLETNGLGSIASSTVASVHTRRAHGLLAVSSRRKDKYTLFSNLDETLYIDEVPYSLSTQMYDESVYPQGYQHLSEFCLFPFPSWIYKIGDIVLLKTFILVQGEETALVRYQMLGGESHLLRLEIKPMLAFRMHNSLCHRDETLKPDQQFKSGFIDLIGKSGFPSLFFYHNAAIVDQSTGWLPGFQYQKEKESGCDFSEDFYIPFRLNYTFLKGREIFLYVTADKKPSIDVDFIASFEENRRRDLRKSLRRSDTRYERMLMSAHSVTLPENDGFGAVNRDPWFEFSPRETIFSLRGLLLALGYYEKARKILVFLSQHIQSGQFSFPENRNFNASDCPELPLWFIQACFDYLRVTEDYETMERTLYPVMNGILEAWQKGSTGFKVETDGLLTKIGPSAPKTRFGALVEIQALWYNALCIMARIADDLGIQNERAAYETQAQKIKAEFNRTFLISEPGFGYLRDSINEGKSDLSFRPHQLWALGLAFPILEENTSKWFTLMEAVRKHLLTPYGLHTLSPKDERYRSQLEGDEARRLKASRDGGISAELLIPFMVAWFRYRPNQTKQDKAEFFKFFTPLWEQMDDGLLGYFAEYIEGAKAHRASGKFVSPSTLAAVLELYLLLSDQNFSAQKFYHFSLR